MPSSRDILLYLLISRTAIVIAGIVSLWLGYKLLARSDTRTSNPDQKSAASTSIEASVVGTRISLKNAAPGTAFALFGALLIIVALIQSSPSVSIETIQKSVSTVPPNGSVTQETRFEARGGVEDSVILLTNMGRERENQHDLNGAVEKYQQALTVLAEPMNDLAWLYLTEDKARVKEALGLATLAVQLRPDEPRYIDTLKKVREAMPQQ